MTEISKYIYGLGLICVVLPYFISSYTKQTYFALEELGEMFAMKITSWKCSYKCVKTQQAGNTAVAQALGVVEKEIAEEKTAEERRH